jgi:hypothetical protein
MVLSILFELFLGLLLFAAVLAYLAVKLVEGAFNKVEKGVEEYQSLSPQEKQEVLDVLSGALRGAQKGMEVYQEIQDQDSSGSSGKLTQKDRERAVRESEKRLGDRADREDIDRFIDKVEQSDVDPYDPDVDSDVEDLLRDIESENESDWKS